MNQIIIMFTEKPGFFLLSLRLFCLVERNPVFLAVKEEGMN